MYFAHMVGNCGLKSWTSNSEIRHAVASQVEGPYTQVLTSGTNAAVLGTFSHNPSVQRVGRESWLLGHIGCGNGTKTPIGTYSGQYYYMYILYLSGVRKCGMKVY